MRARLRPRDAEKCNISQARPSGSSGKRQKRYQSQFKPKTSISEQYQSPIADSLSAGLAAVGAAEEMNFTNGPGNCANLV